MRACPPNRPLRMPRPPAVSDTSIADFEAIEAAVMETERGRWFLAEYARRNRHSDTQVLLSALSRIERGVSQQKAFTGIERFRTEVLDRRHRAHVQADAERAHHDGATGTPTLYINGVRYRGDSDRASLESALSEALAR